jgi:hypothetical protein
MWANVRRAIRLQEQEPEHGLPWLFVRGVRWVGPALAAVAVLAVAIFGIRTMTTPAAAARTEVLRVETGLADASTMVYEDRESGWTVIWVMPSEEEVSHVDS